MKVATAIVERILIDMGSSVDIITWDCLKRLKYPRREIISLIHPILGFGGQEVNLTRMIHLPLHFGDKTKARTLEVDFLVIDVPTASNVILGQSILHKVKAVIAPYLLQLQFKADDGSLGTMQGDQMTTPECYLVSIHPLVERIAERRAITPSPPDKNPRSGPPPPAAEALIIQTMALAKPERPRSEAVDGVE